MKAIRHATILDIPMIQELIEATWFPTYSAFVPEAQLDHMLKQFYSTAELMRLIESRREEFIMIDEHEEAMGFASYGRRPENLDVYKLHKLYVKPLEQARGFGKDLIEYVMARAAEVNAKAVELNVNRNNKAVSFYKRMGFSIVREEDVNMCGFLLPDYVMRREL